MQRKSKPSDYIEPMPKNCFLKLMKDFKSIGGKYLADENSEAFLNLQGAEACTLNGYTILFKKHPSRAAVYEELFHAQQFRDGKITGTVRNSYEYEIEAQRYLLDNAEELQLTEPEIQQTRKALDYYKRMLNEMKGDETYDNM